MRLPAWITRLLAVTMVVVPLVLSSTVKAESGCHRNDGPPPSTPSPSGYPNR